MISKSFTLPSQSVATTAGNVIAVTTSVKASQVQSGPATEWASFAARYQQYRVKAVRVRMTPVYPVSGPPVASGQTGHSQLYVGDYIGSSVPTTAAQVLSDERAIVVSTFKAFTYTVTSKRNPNALLWNPTTAAVPSANDFGIAWASSTVAALLCASTIYYAYDVEWVVEFRGSQ
jgi:hypothetical protein